MNAEIVTARAVETAIVRKTLESSIGEAGDSNWKPRINANLRESDPRQSAFICGLICFGTYTNEFEEAGGRAEDDAADQKPGLRAEPTIQKVTNGAKGNHGSEQRDPSGVGKTALSVLVLIVAVRHPLPTFSREIVLWHFVKHSATRMAHRVVNEAHVRTPTGFAAVYGGEFLSTFVRGPERVEVVIEIGE